MALIDKENTLLARDGFSNLRGADLVFAYIAQVEDAVLVTKDGGFDNVKSHVNVLDLRHSLHTPLYRERLGMD